MDNLISLASLFSPLISLGRQVELHPVKTPQHTKTTQAQSGRDVFPHAWSDPFSFCLPNLYLATCGA